LVNSEGQIARATVDAPSPADNHALIASSIATLPFPPVTPV
jgi:hypothetical protein